MMKVPGFVVEDGHSPVEMEHIVRADRMEQKSAQTEESGRKRPLPQPQVNIAGEPKPARPSHHDIALHTQQPLRPRKPPGMASSVRWAVQDVHNA